MTTEKTSNPEPKIPAQDIGALFLIEQHLKSIRSMLSFFTVLVILGFVLTACNVLLSI